MRKHLADILFLAALVTLSATPGLPGRAYDITGNIIQLILALYVLVLILAMLKNALVHAMAARHRHKKTERVKKPKRRRHRLR